MNRAERVGADGDQKRSNTVGFALTVLQRRLASSPEAIWRSIERRRHRLERRLSDMNASPDGGAVGDLSARLAVLLGRSADRIQDIIDDDLADLPTDEREEAEEEVVDAATAARTRAGLQIEIGILTDLEEVARQVRHAGTDTKWSELRALLLDEDTMRAPDGSRRRLIVLTEHRDTLAYLIEKVRGVLVRDEAVVAIHGGVRREERRSVQTRVTSDPDDSGLLGRHRSDRPSVIREPPSACYS